MANRFLYVLLMLGILSGINSMPIEDDAEDDQNIIASYDAFIQLQQEVEPSFDDNLEARDKRDVKTSSEIPQFLVNDTHSNETSFEDYEKEYLINLNKELLEQFLHYDKYLKHLKEKENASYQGGSTPTSPTVTPYPPSPLPHSGNQTTPDVRVDNTILEQKLLELRAMNVNQLTNVFNSLRHAAKDGVEDPGITSLCCNIG